MIRLTNDQRAALEALCRTIVPSAFESPATSDLADHVAERIGDLAPFHRRRALLALTLFSSRTLSFILLGMAITFERLPEGGRHRMLERCGSHRAAPLRQLFSSMRRLIVHTHYGRAEVRAQIGHAGPLHERAPTFAWEGPLAAAQPVVSERARDIVRERVVPPGVHEAISVTADKTIKTRVCIIGSGVGGATAAAILAEAGHDVVVLEKGGYNTAADFRDDETHALRTLYADAGLRSTDELNVSILQGQCAGGGSTVNWMVMLRTPEWVLEEWRRKHGTEDMDVAAMHGAFDEFERANNVGVVADQAHSPINRLILNSAATLGWHAQGASVDARECMRSGACGLGCRYDAKQSAVVTQLPRALRAGAQLYCGVDVSGIERMNGGYRVRGIVGGRTLTVDADYVVVAAGAVESPALLQRSGLAGQTVGKHLRLHPTTAVVGVYDQPFYAAAGIPLTAYCDEFIRLRDDHGHWIEAPPLSAGLSAVALPGFGDTHASNMKQFPNLAPLIVLVRDGAPSAPSIGRVRTRTNDTSISYRFGSADRATLVHGMESAARMHFAAGAGSVLTLHGREVCLRSEADLPMIGDAMQRYGDPSLFSAHVNGTCRIGSSPRDGACGPDGQVFGQRGLYVMDGSLLPTAPGVNPHETIAAVVGIIAQKLASRI